MIVNRTVPWFLLYFFPHDDITYLTLNLRSAGVSGRTRCPGGGGNITPPLLTHEPPAVARLARWQSKALNKYFPRELKKDLKKVTSQVKVRSKVKTVTFRLIGY